MTRPQWWLVSLVGLIGLQSALPVQGQTLADVAYLAQLARNGATGTTPTFTQADLPPVDARPTRPQPQPPTTEQYQALLDASLERERDLERLLRETTTTRRPARLATQNEAEPQREEARGHESTGGGIPLALAYGSSPGPLYYLGQPVRGSRSERRGHSRPRRTGDRGRVSAPSSALSDNGANDGAVPAPPAVRRQPARSGYAESSRPLNYAAPGIPIPRVQSPSRPGAR